MSTPVDSDQAYFNELVEWLVTKLVGDEILLANVAGEQSDFIRFNQGDVRQAGSVKQLSLTIDLVEGKRHTEGTTQLASDPGIDRARLDSLLDVLREQRRLVPEDPFLAFNSEVASSESFGQDALPDPADALGDIRAGAGSHDLVGIYAAGVTFSGFANSLGQHNWHQAATFNLDWSFYLRADKAAKNLYAGLQWDDEAFASKVDWSRRQLSVLEREPITLDPGMYRTYLAPAAMAELVELWGYSAFGERSHQTRQTPLLRMITEGAALSGKVRISEDTAHGVAPNFEESGFVRPDEVVLIDGGVYANTLVSPRSAAEYGVATNGASAWESPDSVAMAGGSLPAANTVEQLGEGLYVGNLWYTNFSDRAACRTTGMTRFATFWVEGGEIVAPVNVMRFDDTAYNLLGRNLVGLTDQAEVILDSSSYEQRSTASFRLPGALVEDMAFTL